MSQKSFRIAVVGLGTVGSGVLLLLQTHRDLLTRHCGRAIEIVAIHARDKNKDRGVDLSAYEWVDDPLTLPDRSDIDCIVEMIGGEEGLAKTLIERALSSGKHVVTANKALLAKYGYNLAKLAEEKGVSLCYEASVAGGIPVIKALREGFSGNSIQAVYGILNGTCNYILTEMRQTGRDFSDVLKEAQAKGYAEADPSFDVEGIDAAHKLCLLTALAFGVKPDYDRIDRTGIRRVTAKDIRFAGELGYKIKLLGIARRLPNGSIEQSMEPCLVSIDSALGAVEGVFNAVFVEGDFIDRALLEGRGAGQKPTASAVVSDLADLARGQIYLPTFGVPVQHLEQAKWAGEDQISSPHYLHLIVTDQPGVIADVSSILRDEHISIESMLQRGRDPGQAVSIILTTHQCPRAAMRRAAQRIENLDSVLAPPTILRVQAF